MTKRKPSHAHISPDHFSAAQHQDNNLPPYLRRDEDESTFSSLSSNSLTVNRNNFYTAATNDSHSHHSLHKDFISESNKILPLFTTSTTEASPPPYNFSDLFNCSTDTHFNCTDTQFNCTDAELNCNEEGIRFSTAFQVFIYIMYNSVFIAAVLGNLLVCYVVFSSPRMRTVTNYLIANLAIGDLLMAILCVPFSYISVLLQYWPFGEFLCHVVSPAQAICVFVSAYTLVALAVDRYVAILYPLKPRLRRSQAVMVIATVWIVAILTALPIAVFTRLNMDAERKLPLCGESAWSDDRHKLAYSLTLMILQYFFPLGVLIFTYTRIAIAVWGKKAPGEAEDGRDQRLAKAKRKTVVMSLAVVAGYTLAWLPLNLFLLLTDLGVEVPHVEYVFFAIHFVAMAHTTYNPLIYAWINVRFRTAFKCVFHKVNCDCTCSFSSSTRRLYSNPSTVTLIKKNKLRSKKNKNRRNRGGSSIGNNNQLCSVPDVENVTIGSRSSSYRQSTKTTRLIVTVPHHERDFDKQRAKKDLAAPIWT